MIGSFFMTNNQVSKYSFDKITTRDWVSRVAAGAQTHRSLGHHLLHPQILRLLVLLKPARFEAKTELSSIKQTAPADPNS